MQSKQKDDNCFCSGRKFLLFRSGFLDVGVERIVDQVVNPKIGSVFQPRIEEIAYKYLGLPPPQKIYDPPPPPLMHPLPPLPLTAPPPPLKVETCSLLPNDLEQVSPDSDKATIKSEIEGDDKTEVDMEMEDKLIDDDESPPFEPLVKAESQEEIKQEYAKIRLEAPDESTYDDNIKKERDNINSKEFSESQSSNNYPSANLEKDTSHSMDCRNSQDSQLSSVSSDTRLSPVTKDDSMPRTSQEEAVTANISEEAQMPKFNENSSEPNGLHGSNNKDSSLHFDIKKDEIKFEGTERKSNLDDTTQVSPLSVEVKCTLSSSALVDDKAEIFKFSSNNNSNAEQKEDDLERTPNAQELSFGSSIEDSTSIPANIATQAIVEDKEKEMSTEEKSPELSTPKQSSTPTSTATPMATPTATPTPPPPFSQTSTTTPSPVSTQKSEKDHSTRNSSTSKHKKHSKERRRSHEREKDKDRYRSSKESRDSKHHHSSSKNSGSKHSSSSSSRYSSSSHNKSSNEKDIEKSSSSHSSSKHAKHSSASSSDKRHSTSNSHRDHSSSSSNTSSKRNERKDDHHEAKHKSYRRKSTDSNDDDGDKEGHGGGKSSSQNHKYNTSNSKTKSKYGNDVIQTPSTKNSGKL